VSALFCASQCTLRHTSAARRTARMQCKSSSSNSEATAAAAASSTIPASHTRGECAFLCSVHFVIHLQCVAQRECSARAAVAAAAMMTFPAKVAAVYTLTPLVLSPPNNQQQQQLLQQHHIPAVSAHFCAVYTSSYICSASHSENAVQKQQQQQQQQQHQR
jgi:hypothetical protein